MGVEQLMQPRYKVIANYPNSVLKTGEILFNHPNAAFDKLKFYGCEKYPHIFKKLEWWEERKIEDMPEYIKTDSGMVWKCSNWIINYRNELQYNAKKYGSNQLFTETSMKYIIPATEEEYNQFITPQTL